MNTKRAGRILAWMCVGIAFLGYIGGWEAVFIIALGILLVEYVT